MPLFTPNPYVKTVWLVEQEHLSPSYSLSFTLPRKNLLGQHVSLEKESRFDRGEVDGGYDKLRPAYIMLADILPHILALYTQGECR
jgi:hypothetical protein